LSLRSNPPEIFFLFDHLCARSTPLGARVGLAAVPHLRALSLRSNPPEIFFLFDHLCA
jgi:hypothetical protein